MAFRLPASDQRVSIVGHTGSGKTYAAAWLLGRMPIDQMPWMVIDYKHDDLLNSIKRTREHKLGAKLPEHPGVYMVHPGPKSDDAVEDLFWQVWEKGNTGVYIDEGHMLPNGEALKSVLTQGRSKHIPVIAITQRPRWVSRFIFSEADHHVAFRLGYPDDQKFIGGILQTDYTELPQYNFYWHNVAQHHTYRLLPVPEGATLASAISAKIPTRTMWRKI